MSSLKCPQCGLTNWATAEACKRCKLSFVEAPAAEPPEAEAAAETHGFDALPPHEAGAAQDDPNAWTHSSTVPPGGWGSPYDNGRGGVLPAGNSLDIDFEVSPFVDVSTTIRDTYALSRSHYRLILKVVLLALAPYILLTFFVSMGGPARHTLPTAESYFGNTPARLPGGGGLLGGLSVILLLVFGSYFLRWAVMPSALIYGIVQTMNTGETPGVFECYGWGLRRSFTAGFAFLLTLIGIILGLVLLVVPGLILGVGLSLVLPVAAIEGVGVFETLRRSLNLTRGRRMTIFGSSFCWTFLLAVVAFMGGILVVVFSMMLGSEVLGSVGVLIISEVLSATHIVFTLVVYLGLAHYRQEPAVNHFWDAAPAGGWDQQPSGREQQPAFAAPHGFGASHPHAAQYQYGYPQPKKSGTSMKLVIAGCVVGFVCCGAIVLAIAVPNLLASRRAANEGLAIKNLRNIVAAEATYSSTDGNGNYGSLEELVKAGLIKPESVKGSAGGYRYKIKIGPDSFEATATPVSYRSTGTRSFYVSENGVIRAGDKRGLEASSQDPPLGSGSTSSKTGGSYGSDSRIIDPGSP